MEPGRERSRHARTICPAAEKCAAAVRIMRADLLGLLPADSRRFAVRASDRTCAAAGIARPACAMCAARLLPRNRCAARLNSRRRYAPVLPLLAVARVACCRVAPVLLLRRGLIASRHDHHHHQHHAPTVRRDHVPCRPFCRRRYSARPIVAL